MSEKWQVAVIKNQWEFCDLCHSRTNIEWKCVHCCQILCHQCRNLHTKGNITMHHFIFNKSEEEKENYWNSVYRCNEHENRNVLFYCNVHKVKVCEICIAEEHKRHDFQTIVQLADDFRRKIKNILSAGHTDENEDNIYNNIITEEDIHLCRKAEQYNFHDWNKLAENFQMFMNAATEYTKKNEEIRLMKSEIENTLNNLWDEEIVHVIEEFESKVKVLQEERISAKSTRDKVNGSRTLFESLKRPASHMLKAVDTSQVVERAYYTEEIAKLKRELERIKKEKQNMEKGFAHRNTEIQQQWERIQKENQNMKKELKEFAEKNIEIQRKRAEEALIHAELENQLEQTVSLYDNMQSEKKKLEMKLSHQLRLTTGEERSIGEIQQEKDRGRADLKANKKILLTRPTEIAEKFSDLYDNEWTDALEELEAANVDEKSSILFLRDTVMKSFRLCEEIAGKQKTESRRCFEELPSPDSEDLKISSAYSDLKLSLDTTVTKEIDRIRKDLAPSTEKLVQERFKVILEENLRIILESINASINERQSVQESNPGKPPQMESQSSPESRSTMHLPIPAKQDLLNTAQLNVPSLQNLEIRFHKLFTYSRKCVSLCWFIRSYSPKLHLEDKAERDSKLDTERFKQYTKTGHTLDYVVWPALFLHEGGPLLGKGVAQPK